MEKYTEKELDKITISINDEDGFLFFTVLEFVKSIRNMEKKVKSLEQQIGVLQDFTGLKESIKENIEEHFKEIQVERNKLNRKIATLKKANLKN